MRFRNSKRLYHSKSKINKCRDSCYVAHMSLRRAFIRIGYSLNECGDGIVCDCGSKIEQNRSDMS